MMTVASTRERTDWSSARTLFHRGAAMNPSVLNSHETTMRPRERPRGTRQLHRVIARCSDAPEESRMWPAHGASAICRLRGEPCNHRGWLLPVEIVTGSQRSVALTELGVALVTGFVAPEPLLALGPASTGTRRTVTVAATTGAATTAPAALGPTVQA